MKEHISADTLNRSLTVVEFGHLYGIGCEDITTQLAH